MNGRTIRKILMRGRVGTFYGARALFVVRFPLGVLPEAMPPFVAPGVASYEGCWSRDNGDGTRTLFNIPEMHGFREPKPRLRKDCFVRNIHHARLVSSEIDEEGELHEDWVWYEGTELLLGPEPEGGKLASTISRKNLPSEMVDAYVAKHRWCAKYALGETPDWTGIDWLDELHRAGNFAKGFRPIIQARSMDFAYFVRWGHPETKLRFCAQMHRALMTAKRAGVDVRVLQPPRKKR